MDNNKSQIRMEAALELLQFKAIRQMCNNNHTCALDENDINEVFEVAGMPMITPQSRGKSLEVIL